MRTPLFPVKKIRDKGQLTEWRFVQDLQAVIAAVQPRAPEVHNPYTILSQIPSDSECYTVIDISNAFFSIPIHKDSQFWFPFSFDCRPYTFTCLCQGYSEHQQYTRLPLRHHWNISNCPKGSHYCSMLMTFCYAHLQETCVQNTPFDWYITWQPRATKLTPVRSN